MSDRDIFFGEEFIWVEIPADPTDLLITLPGDRAPSFISTRNNDPYKNVWCEGNRLVPGIRTLTRMCGVKETG
jgi:hypothetical protein